MSRAFGMTARSRDTADWPMVGGSRVHFCSAFACVVGFPPATPLGLDHHRQSRRRLGHQPEVCALSMKLVIGDWLILLSGSEVCSLSSDPRPELYGPRMQTTQATARVRKVLAAGLMFVPRACTTVPVRQHTITASPMNQASTAREKQMRVPSQRLNPQRPRRGSPELKRHTRSYAAVASSCSGTHSTSYYVTGMAFQKTIGTTL